MRRGLPNRELAYLEKWYEDYMYAKYGGVKKSDDHPTEEEIIAGAPWESEQIVGGQT